MEDNNNNNNHNNKRQKLSQWEFSFNLTENYLSGNAEIVSVEFWGRKFEHTQKFHGLQLKIICQRNEKNGTLLDFLVQFKQDKSDSLNSETVYNLVLQNHKDHLKSRHVQVRPGTGTKQYCLNQEDNQVCLKIPIDYDNDDESDFEISDEEYDQEDYYKFQEIWTLRIQEYNHITIQVWQQQQRIDEQKQLEFTDCIINNNTPYSEEQQQQQQQQSICFRANISTLIQSSQVIYNMIKDLNQQYTPQNPCDLSAIFDGFSSRHVHMYLCCIYNQNFSFSLLIDIIKILQLSIKLDNQSLISRILNMEQLAKIVRKQINYFPIHMCEEEEIHIDFVLDFAKKYNMHNLIVFCELMYLMDRRQFEHSEALKKIIDAYRDV